MKSYKYLITMILALGFVSCEKESSLDFFEKEYPKQAPWQSAADFENAAIGSYWLLCGANSGKTTFINQRLVLDGASDGFYWDPDFYGEANSGLIYDRSNETNISYVDNIFSATYQVIGTTTDAISFLETGENNNPYPFDINKTQIPRLEGEIRFVRAFAWWILSTIYTPMYDQNGSNSDRRIPLLDNIPGGFSEAVNGELATTQQIYDIMISDLERAIEILPEKYVDGVHNMAYKYGRVNKYGAMMLLTRIYLQMNEFEKAEDLCDAIINYSETSGYYTLNVDPINAFNTNSGFTGEGTEVIWYYLQYEGDGIGSWTNNWIAERMSKCRRYGDINEGRAFSCSDAFLETVGWQDPVTKEPTAEALADKRYNQLYHRYKASVEMPAGYPTPTDGVYEPSFVTERARVWGNKYYRAESNRLRTNIPIFRLPEVYLTRAILRFKNGDVTGATSDVNKVRARSGLVDLAAVTEADIHNERWKEFNFEGDRLNYLRSLRKDIPAGDRGGAVTPWNSDVWEWAILLREEELNNAYR